MKVNVGHFNILHFLCALNCVWIHQQQIQKLMFFYTWLCFFCLFSGLTHYKPSQYVQYYVWHDSRFLNTLLNVFIQGAALCGGRRPPQNLSKMVIKCRLSFAVFNLFVPVGPPPGPVAQQPPEEAAWWVTPWAVYKSDVECRCESANQ